MYSPKEIKKSINFCFKAFFFFLIISCKPKVVGNVPNSDELITVNFTADNNSIFSNPERGWHNRRNITRDRDFNSIKTAGNTLVHSYIRLDNFKFTDNIPQSFLDSLQDGLNAVRNAGLKVILRGTHVWEEVPSVSEDRILKHIEQVNAVISANADIVSHIEAGYLGKWGEWHSGLYTDLNNRNDGNTRFRIIKKLLETTPDNIPIVMRYPMHIREILNEIPVPANSTPLTQVQKDRIGHHNDCFLFDNSDRGTYARNNMWFGSQTLIQQKQYAFDLITSYGGNKMMGGETCEPAIDRIGSTQVEMEALNFSEINFDFWSDAITRWKNINLPASETFPSETEFARISKRIGYRLRLVSANFSLKGKANNNFSFSATLNNDGYAGVVKSRPIFLVFDNGINRFNLELKSVDVRTWVSGNINLLSQNIKLPSDMPAGSYKLALWLPDAATKLQSRSSYSIRFANKDVWDETKGYNVLHNSISITN